MGSGATIDSTKLYRYLLWRAWDDNLPRVLFIMLNPSTADAFIDDPTIRRCIRFAKDLGFGSLEVVNLFAYRATDPNELRKCTDPIGPENDTYIKQAAKKAEKIILAWGEKGNYLGRDQKVIENLSGYRLYCLKKTKDGHPRHPLFLPSTCEPIEY